MVAVDRGGMDGCGSGSHIGIGIDINIGAVAEVYAGRMCGW